VDTGRSKDLGEAESPGRRPVRIFLGIRRVEVEVEEVTVAHAAAPAVGAVVVAAISFEEVGAKGRRVSSNGESVKSSSSSSSSSESSFSPAERRAADASSFRHGKKE
jgi:hypothetical protein